MKVTMKDRKIPVRNDGYPNLTVADVFCDDESAIFTPAEIVELVNRALYQLDYQKTAHAKYQQRQRDFQAPIKNKLKELFPGTSWIKATPEQVKAAMEAAYPSNDNRDNKEE